MIRMADDASAAPVPPPRLPVPIFQRPYRPRDIPLVQRLALERLVIGRPAPAHALQVPAIHSERTLAQPRHRLTQSALPPSLPKLCQFIRHCAPCRRSLHPQRRRPSRRPRPEGVRAMIRLFKHYVPYAVLLLGAIDFVLLIARGRGGLVAPPLAARTARSIPTPTRLPNLLAFAVTLQLAMVGVGVYGGRGAAIDALRRRAAAGRGGARHHRCSRWSSSSSRRSPSGAPACSTRCGSALVALIARPDRARVRRSAASGSSGACSCSAPAPRAARIEALAARARAPASPWSASSA